MIWAGGQRVIKKGTKSLCRQPIHLGGRGSGPHNRLHTTVLCLLAVPQCHLLAWPVCVDHASLPPALAPFDADRLASCQRVFQDLADKTAVRRESTIVCEVRLGVEKGRLLGRVRQWASVGSLSAIKSGARSAAHPCQH